MGMTLGQCSAEPVTGAIGRAWTAFAADPNSGVSGSALIVGSPTQLMVAAILSAAVKGIYDEIIANALVVGTAVT